MEAAMKWYHYALIAACIFSFEVHVLATAWRLDDLRNRLEGVQQQLGECAAGAMPVEMETIEITTPDGRYTIKVERPVNGLLEMHMNEKPGEPEPGLFGPEPMILPGHGPQVFTTGEVF
jgi:hypothetical protein